MTAAGKFGVLLGGVSLGYALSNAVAMTFGGPPAGWPATAFCAFAGALCARQCWKSSEVAP